LQDLDTEIVVATARGPNTSATAVAANVVVDERQMNALFLDLVSSFTFIFGDIYCRFDASMVVGILFASGGWLVVD